MGPYVLVIDQGTTSSRAIVFDAEQTIAGMAKMEFTQHYPQPGWVEHVPDEIWATCLWACKAAMRKAGITAAEIAAIGITNQRETTIVWDRATGKPIYNAIVWQDRRTAPICSGLKKLGLEKQFARATGLLLDPYFSGTKVKWLLDNVKGARKRAQRGELAFGTVDSFLIWRLTGGRMHATDATNASRTLMFNIETNRWDPGLLKALNVPASLLPEVKDSADDFGVTDADILGAPIPIRGVVGDQQAAMIGQACFAPGMLKSTYGSSCFALLNTGTDLVRSKNRLLSTIAYRLDGKTTYALEGVIFTVGGLVQWLHDDIGVLDSISDTDTLALASDAAEEVYMIPAFTGLGAPWWDANARGAVFGLTRNTRKAELVRAALEAVGYQTRDLVDAMRKDWKGARDNIVLRVDGGMVQSDWTMQFLADIVDAYVERPTERETTALGAAWLAGWKGGVWPDSDGFSRRWVLGRQFRPDMAAGRRQKKLRGWRNAVRRTLSTQ
ncbi:MAG: Glycerol kinase [Hyphomicrobiales bacterium]|nr:Glycerol kinase [Hyphomicrobiales bacterium]